LCGQGYPRLIVSFRAADRWDDTTGDDLGLIAHPAPNVEPVTCSCCPTGGRRSSPAASRSAVNVRAFKKHTVRVILGHLRIEKGELEAGGLN
jgi:hypothetical protein